MSDHARIDARSLALHRLVAEKVRANPALLDVARDNLRRWQEQGAYVSAFDEWREILDGPFDEVMRFLADPSERATRLRQSSPFPGILTDEERLAIFRRYAISKDRLTAAHIERPDWPIEDDQPKPDRSPPHPAGGGGHA